MSLTRLFFNDFEPLFRLVEDPHGRQASSLDQQLRQAVAELSEEGTQYVVRAELPGVQKQDLDIHVGNDGRSLTIEGRVHRTATNNAQPKESNSEKKSQEVSKGTPTDSQPFEYHSVFSRTVWFPHAVDGKKAQAKLEDGVLTLNIPKRESGVQKISLN